MGRQASVGKSFPAAAEDLQTEEIIDEREEGQKRTREMSAMSEMHESRI